MSDNVFRFRNAALTNTNRNEYIVEDYILESNPAFVGFDRHGNLGYRLLSESKRELYFSVR